MENSSKNNKIGTVVGEPRSIRGINEMVVRKYGVTATDSVHNYPYYNTDGKVVAYKIRYVANKGFSVQGDLNSALLFGANLFNKGERILTITEGEIDAMSAYQMLGHASCVVSVPNGAAGSVTAIKRNLNYIESFDEVVLCFDNDEAGVKAVEHIVKVLSPNKLKIMKLRHGKDANEYLKNNKVKEFVDDFWRAEKYSPDDIVLPSKLKESVVKKTVVPSIPYPFEGLNSKTYGIRKGEMVTIMADTGVGKTQFVREVVYNILQQDKTARIGTMFIEETPAISAEGLMSIHSNLRLHLPDTECPDSLREKVFDEVFSDERVVFYDHFGSNSVDDIVSKIRYYVKALDCDYIVLDHLHIIVSDQRHLDERKALDEIVTKLKSLTMELGCAIITVAHTNRVGLIRGTAGIEQLSNIIISLERDKEAEDDTIRNTTKVVIKKNRFSGDTGTSCHLLYDNKTGRLKETTPPSLEFKDEKVLF